MTTATAGQHDPIHQLNDEHVSLGILDLPMRSRHRQSSKRALQRGDTRRRVEDILDAQALEKQFSL